MYRQPTQAQVGERSRDADATPINALPGPALRSLREAGAAGISRRRLLRLSLAAGIGLWFAELGAGTIAFLWSVAAAANRRVRVGTLADVVALNPGLPIRDGFPAYVPEARAFVVLIDPSRGTFTPGSDAHGDGRALNVRALSQRCPHLGCRPNPCIDDFWFTCPCHRSRYDRLGTKALGVTFGPAPRSMDRFAVEVDGSGVLAIDTRSVTLGPLPVALGQPDLIPPRVLNGCT